MRWLPVWRRNMLVWRKLVAASVLTNLADPLIMLFGLGYGLGALMPSIEGMSYIAFFAAGQLCTATMFTASFESILVFAGFTLGLNTFFTVLGVFVLRWRRPDLRRPYRAALYPLPPLIFLGFTGWTLSYILLQRPEEGLMGLAIVASGGAFYLLTIRLGKGRVATPR